jgi:hypothetical protein
MSGRQRLLRDQTDLFVAAQAVPAGFVYQDDIISPADERVLLDRFQDLPFKPFEFHGFFGNRRVVSFGWRYDFAGGRLRESEPVPAFLLPCVNRQRRLRVFRLRGCSRSSSTNMRPARALAGIVTKRCSRT